MIVIDVQRGFDNPKMGRRNNPETEGSIRRLLDAWRATGRPIFHVKHNSGNPRSTFRKGRLGNEIKEEARPSQGEPVIEKDVNSAFIGTNLEERLRKGRVRSLAIVGLCFGTCSTMYVGVRLPLWGELLHHFDLSPSSSPSPRWT